jgi:hypothetical protein
VVLVRGTRALVFAEVVAKKVGTVMKRCAATTGGGDIGAEVRIDSGAWCVVEKEEARIDLRMDAESQLHNCIQTKGRR